MTDDKFVCSDEIRKELDCTRLSMFDILVALDGLSGSLTGVWRYSKETREETILRLHKYLAGVEIPE